MPQTNQQDRAQALARKGQKPHSRFTVGSNQAKNDSSFNRSFYASQDNINPLSKSAMRGGPVAYESIGMTTATLLPAQQQYSAMSSQQRVAHQHNDSLFESSKETANY